MMKKIRIGTRKSLLARVQTHIVAEKIRQAAPDLEIEVIPVVTEGDIHLDRGLSSFGGKGVFTKELETALLEGRIHMAVHSAKDMPSEFPEGLTLGAVVERAAYEDVVVTTDGCPLREMAEGTLIGTGSLRRSLQLQALNSGLKIKDIRGNVQSRLKKLDEGQYDGILLARAGLERLRTYEGAEGEAFYSRFCYEILDVRDCIPAAGQAILAVEVAQELMDGCPGFSSLCRRINDEAAENMLAAERSFLEYIGGGCNAPAAACARIEGDSMVIKGCFSGDGRRMNYDDVAGAVSEGRNLGRKLAHRLISKG